MMHMATEGRDWLETVYVTLDDACIEQGALPPGTTAKLSRITDSLKRTDETDFRTRAEAILLTLHELQCALRASTGTAQLKRKLRAMSDDWIRATPIFH